MLLPWLLLRTKRFGREDGIIIVASGDLDEAWLVMSWLSPVPYLLSLRGTKRCAARSKSSSSRATSITSSWKRLESE